MWHVITVISSFNDPSAQPHTHISSNPTSTATPTLLPSSKHQEETLICVLAELKQAAATSKPTTTTTTTTNTDEDDDDGTHSSSSSRGPNEKKKFPVATLMKTYSELKTMHAKLASSFVCLPPFPPLVKYNAAVAASKRHAVATAISNTAAASAAPLTHKETQPTNNNTDNNNNAKKTAATTPASASATTAAETHNVLSPQFLNRRATVWRKYMQSIGLRRDIAASGILDRYLFKRDTALDATTELLATTDDTGTPDNTNSNNSNNKIRPRTKSKGAKMSSSPQGKKLLAQLWNQAFGGGGGASSSPPSAADVGPSTTASHKRGNAPADEKELKPIGRQPQHANDTTEDEDDGDGGAAVEEEKSNIDNIIKHQDEEKKSNVPTHATSAGDESDGVVVSPASCTSGTLDGSVNMIEDYDKAKVNTETESGIVAAAGTNQRSRREHENKERSAPRRKKKSKRRDWKHVKGDGEYDLTLLIGELLEELPCSISEDLAVDLPVLSVERAILVGNGRLVVAAASDKTVMGGLTSTLSSWARRIAMPFSTNGNNSAVPSSGGANGRGTVVAGGGKRALNSAGSPGDDGEEEDFDDDVCGELKGRRPLGGVYGFALQQTRQHIADDVDAARNSADSVKEVGEELFREAFSVLFAKRMRSVAFDDRQRRMFLLDMNGKLRVYEADDMLFTEGLRCVCRLDICAGPRNGSPASSTNLEVCHFFFPSNGDLGRGDVDDDDRVADAAVSAASRESRVMSAPATLLLTFNAEVISFNLDELKVNGRILLPRARVSCLALGAMDNIIFVGLHDHTVAVYVLKNGQFSGLKDRLVYHKGPVHSMSYDASSRVLAVGSADRCISMWKVPDGCYTPGAKTAEHEHATASANQEQQLLQQQQQKKKKRRLRPAMYSVLRGHHATVSALEFSVDGMLLASGDAQGHVVVWSRLLGAALFAIRPFMELGRRLISSISFDEGVNFLTVSSSQTLVVFRLSDGDSLALPANADTP